jgi:hypothetical protein
LEKDRIDTYFSTTVLTEMAFIKINVAIEKRAEPRGHF